MAEPPFPTKVRIGFKTYQIEDWAPKAAAAAHRYGEASHLEGVIRVDRSHGVIQSAETLFHELMHGITQVGHDDLFKGDDGERVVTAISAGWAQVMRDNLDLCRWFAWAWEQDD